MNLTAREKDKLLVSMAAVVARRRLERGVKLNHPEAIALITDFVVEGARDGRTVADLMEAGAHVVTRDGQGADACEVRDRVGPSGVRAAEDDRRAGLWPDQGGAGISSVPAARPGKDPWRMASGVPDA
jgi:urease subunit gamma